jgi:hypothetical protein
MFNHKFRSILILIWLLHFSVSANAQTAGSATLTPPETKDFPKIHSYLEVYDGFGNFVHNLQEDDVRIIEDSKSIPLLTLEELEVGAQFVVAINSGPALGIRDSNGISRYDSVKAAINSWAENFPTHLDDLSLLTNDTPERLHIADPDRFRSSFLTYNTDPRAATPSLDVLVRAINVASDPLPRQGMGRAILLLTPPPSRTGSATLQSIISLARQDRIQINVWMVSSSDLFTSEGATLLVELAHQTGGKFFAFSGTEIIPNIEDYLDPLRYIYSLTYESQIKNGEPHQITANTHVDGIEISSPPQDFKLLILPPNPIFLSPPLQIFRANRSELSEALSDEAEYTPKTQPLDILIEFPDELPRPLNRTTLFVDGVIMDENTSIPFDKFTWDLNDYTSSDPHTIQVEAVDSLGLSNTSIEHTVQITVQQTPQSVINTIVQNAPIIAGALVAIAGGVLILVLVIGGRIQPKTFGRQRGKRAQKANNQAVDNGAIPTPLSEGSAIQKRRFSNWVNRISWPQKSSSSPKPIAYLERLTDDDNHSPKERIPITSDEMTFGSDPKEATTIFNDPSVDNLHTRLKVNPQGDITIHDEGSRAGTWVNFAQISSEGVKLAHGDIIHIGRLGFCFKMTDKKQIPKPIVRPQELRS